MQTGKRDTGTFSGTMTFSRKMTSALAVFLVGVVLESFGWIRITDANPNPTQPPSVVTAMRVVIIVSVAVFMTIAFIASYKLKINPEKTNKIRKYLELQREGKLNELTDDEVREYTVMGKELIGSDFEVIRNKE
jgi:oligogalacturonide transporter